LVWPAAGKPRMLQPCSLCARKLLPLRANHVARCPPGRMVTLPPPMLPAPALRPLNLGAPRRRRSIQLAVVQPLAYPWCACSLPLPSPTQSGPTSVPRFPLLASGTGAEDLLWRAMALAIPCLARTPLQIAGPASNLASARHGLADEVLEIDSRLQKTIR